MNDLIIENAARLFGISRSDLIGPSRVQHIVAARQAVAYALREETGLSLAEIGRLLGKRDHTTMIYAITQAERRACADPAYALVMSALLRR